MKNKIRKSVLIAVFLFFIFWISIAIAGVLGKSDGASVSKNDDSIGKTTENISTTLRKCVNDEVGISFKCDPSWKLSRQGRMLKITISKVPHVEMVVEESESKIHFMSEINAGNFASMGRYEEGFYSEHLTYCNRETIKINGYLKGNPGVRVSDFYLIDHLHLHTIQFTVDPKDAWEQYKWLIKEIVASVRFIKHESDVKLGLEPSDETCEDLVL